jgi:hypothetical protein
MAIHGLYKLSNVVNMDCLLCLFQCKTNTISVNTKIPSPKELLRRSPSERFGHISPDVLKRLDPCGTVPVFNPDCQVSKDTYKAHQNRVIDRLMGFHKDEKLNYN